MARDPPLLTRRQSFIAAWGLLAASGASGADSVAKKDGDEPDWKIFDEKDDPTSWSLIGAILRLAQVRRGDVLYDLGSGDGRIVIAANKIYGVRSTGIEFNPEMVLRSRSNAVKRGAAVKIIEGDIFEVDFSDASVVIMYLWESINIRLAPKLLQLRPGTRLVSHEHAMGEWRPDRTIHVDAADESGLRPLHLWVVPAQVGGHWEIKIGDTLLNAEFVQRYQRIETTSKRIRRPTLNGDQIAFEVQSSGRWRRIFGRAIEDAMDGPGWKARRVSAKSISRSSTVP